MNGYYSTIKVTLRHLKSRHGEAKDLALDFDKRTQRFTVAEDPRLWKPDGGPERDKLQSELAAAWANTVPADEDVHTDLEGAI